MYSTIFYGIMEVKTIMFEFLTYTPLGAFIVFIGLALFWVVKPAYFAVLIKNRMPKRLEVIIASLLILLGLLIVAILFSTGVTPDENNKASPLAALWALLGMGLVVGYWYWLVSVRGKLFVAKSLSSERLPEFSTIEPIKKNTETSFFEKQTDFSNPPAPAPAPAPAPVRIPCEYWMMYRDVDGNETARDFDLIKVYERHNRWYFDAHCDLVSDERTFRVDRVELLKNNDTGKMWSLEKDIRKHFRELSRNGGF